MSTTRRADARHAISLRLTDAQLSLLEEAATRRGFLTTTEFVRTTAVQEAQRVVAEPEQKAS